MRMIPIFLAAAMAVFPNAYASAQEATLPERLASLITGVSAAPASPTPLAPETVPERLIEDLQEDFDLSKPQAASIAGNLAHESGNFRMLHEINGTCYGYSQWCGVRKRAFRAYAASAGGQETYEANYGFLKHELETEYEAMLRGTDQVEVAARIFMKEFLRPAAKTANLTRRVRFARQYLEGDFSGSGCFSHHRLEAKNRPAACPDDV